MTMDAIDSPPIAPQMPVWGRGLRRPTNARNVMITVRINLMAILV